MTRGWEIPALGPERWGGATESHRGKCYSGEASQRVSCVSFLLLQQKSLRKPTSKGQKLPLLTVAEISDHSWVTGALGLW